MFDGAVIGGVAAGFGLRRMPQAVAAVIMPGIASRLSNIRKFLEQIWSTLKGQANDARTDIRGRDQFNILVGQSDAPRPSAVRNFLHLYSHERSM